MSFHSVGNHHPNWRTPSFFRGVGIPPTRYYWVCMRELYGRGTLELPSKFHELVVSVKKPPNRPFFGVESTRRSELKEPAAQTAVAVWDSHGKGWGNHRLGWFDGRATGTDWLEVPIPYRRPICQAKISGNIPTKYGEIPIDWWV